MPRKKLSGDTPGVQIVFRVPREQHDALQTAAAGLSLDMSSLLRMMIAEHVAEYVDRATRATAALGQARAALPQHAAPENLQETGSGPQPAGRRRRSILVDTGTPESEHVAASRNR
jgi:hypothetical protein